MKAKAMFVKKSCAEMQRRDIAQEMVNLIVGLKLWLNQQMHSTEKITEEFLDMIRRLKNGNGSNK